MANLHRKLIQETINISISVTSCPSFCIPTNDLSLCSNPCLSLCSSICHYSIPSIIPPLDDPEYTPTSNHHPLNHHKLHPLLIITLATLATTFLLVSLYTIYVKFYSRRRRRSSQSQRQPQPDDQMTHDNHQFLDEDHGPEIDHPIWYIRTVGLQPSVITAITVCKYKRGDGLVEGTDCSVCLSEFQEDETLRLLPKCNHAFHIPCIDTWLQSHTNCPMCRAGIVATTIRSPSPELNVDNTDILEDTRVRISENDGEVGREREDEVCELRDGGTEERSELRIENEGERCENSKERVGEIQPLRRSVSMDSLTASMISLSLANVIPVVESDNKSEDQLVKVSKSDIGNQRLLRIMGSSSSSIGRSLQNGPSSMKRSLSCTGKLLLSRYSRSRNSVLPF